VVDLGLAVVSRCVLTFAVSIVAIVSLVSIVVDVGFEVSFGVEGFCGGWRSQLPQKRKGVT
jgi:hypothetical protein